MGRSLVRGILNSAHGISDKDSSPQAQAKRRIRSFADLDGLEFLARIDIGKDTSGEDKNEIRVAVTPDHKDYATYMGAVAARPAAQPVAAPTADPAAARASGRPGRSEGRLRHAPPSQAAGVRRAQPARARRARRDPRRRADRLRQDRHAVGGGRQGARRRRREGLRARASRRADRAEPGQVPAGQSRAHHLGRRRAREVLGGAHRVRHGADPRPGRQPRRHAGAGCAGGRRGASRGRRHVPAHHREGVPAQPRPQALRRHGDAEPRRQARPALDLLERRRPDPDRRADRRRQPGPPAHLRDRRRSPVGARQGQAQGRRLRHGGGRRDHEPHADHRPGHPSLARQGRRSPDRGVLLDGRPRHGRSCPLRRGRRARGAGNRRHGRG